MDKKIGDDIAEAFHEAYHAGYKAGDEAGKRDTTNRLEVKMKAIQDDIKYTLGWNEGYKAGKEEAVRHAYNKCEEYHTLFECSACGEGCHDTALWDNTEIEYCPHCGAKMTDGTDGRVSR